MFNCSCCGTEVTSPYFFDGGVYGWSCIKKVNPNVKRNKPKTKAFPIEILKIKYNSENTTRGDALILANGIKRFLTVHHEWDYEKGCRKDSFEFSSNLVNKLNDTWYLMEVLR